MRTAPRPTASCQPTPAEAIAAGSPSLLALILNLGMTTAGRLARRGPR